ncbi:MAG: hypothetical protein PHQ90_07860 [Sulfuricurvum sp.]|uniref:hypothetical protein n=1 Tax=Sulfuricurvum sp. TaxID=2025608 RepID=UPI0026264700|nr:hypothetical protein [Sulfuricurvum sp.]MDD2369200.1 hypothetical protein [Sulfuricurvum sp.]MDD2951515.1 hypothetical protein [Sulfuricurvum sp.]MDD5118058.1 hypothetical protein [Sulfuricurvum sp.]
MKKFALRLLIILAILILIVIISHLIGIDNFNKKFNIDKDNFPLWASIGVIISALMATTSSALTMENANKQNELNKIKQKNTEFNYALHHLIKIKMTFSSILDNRGKLHQYSDVALEQMSKDSIIFADKLDSKDLFYFFSQDSAGKVMNIITRLQSIAFAIEYYRNQNLEQQAAFFIQDIENNLINHPRGFSLLPLTEDVITYLQDELKKEGFEI